VNARSSICVVGHVTLDHVDSTARPGGSALYASGVYLGAGADVTLVTAFAQGDAQAFDLERLSLKLSPSDATTRFENVYDGEHARTQRLSSLASTLAPPATGHWDVLHLAPVMTEMDPLAWLVAVDARVVGLGLPGWLRDASPADRGRVRPKRPDSSVLAAGRDCVAFASDEDLRGLPGLLTELRQAFDLFYLTRGEAGVRVFRAGAEPEDVAALHVPAVVDATGAGDAFAACALLALAQGDDPLAAAGRGVCAAAIAITHAGAPAPRAYASTGA